MSRERVTRGERELHDGVARGRRRNRDREVARHMRCGGECRRCERAGRCGERERADENVVGRRRGHADVVTCVHLQRRRRDVELVDRWRCVGDDRVVQYRRVGAAARPRFGVELQCCCADRRGVRDAERRLLVRDRCRIGAAVIDRLARRGAERQTDEADAVFRGRVVRDDEIRSLGQRCVVCRRRRCGERRNIGR